TVQAPGSRRFERGSHRERPLQGDITVSSNPKSKIENLRSCRFRANLRQLVRQVLYGRIQLPIDLIFAVINFGMSRMGSHVLSNLDRLLGRFLDRRVYLAAHARQQRRAEGRTDRKSVV